MKIFSGGTRLVNFLIHPDTVRKVMAVLLAILLYGSVTYKSDIQSQDFPGVTVELELPPDVVNAQGTRLAVLLKVRCAARLISRLTAESFSCRLPVNDSEVQPGRTIQRKLQPSMFNRPFGVEIEAVEPKVLNLKLDRVISRPLPIRQVFDSEERLPVGFGIRSVAIRPNEVTVTGPSLIVNGLQQARTVPVPVDSTTREGFDYVAKLQQLAGVAISPEQVTVHVEIGRKNQGERILSSLDYNLLLSPEQKKYFSVEPSPGTPVKVEVVVRGPDEVRKMMNRNWIRLFADVTDLKRSGEYILPLTGAFVNKDARDLEIVRITPDRIRVMIRPLAGEKNNRKLSK